MKQPLTSVGGRYADETWYVPFIQGSELLPFLFSKGFAVTPQAREHFEALQKFLDRNIELSTSSSDDWNGTKFEGRFPIALEPRPYQWDGVEYMLTNYRTILGDALGDATAA